MSKFISTVIGALILLSGCQAVQDQAAKVRQEGEQTVNGFSQQAENVQNQVLEAKTKFDRKSQEIVNTVQDVNNAVNDANKIMGK